MTKKRKKKKAIKKRAQFSGGKILFLIVLLIFFVGIFAGDITTRFMQPTPSIPKPTPSKEYSNRDPVPSYDEKLLWVNDNTHYDKLTYSYEIPYSGPYCAGCFDGSGGLTGMALEQVEGGFFKTGNPFLSKRDWLVLNGVFTPGHYSGGGWEVMPAGNFYDYFASQQVGQEFQITDTENKSHTATRLPDRNISGTNFMIFKSDINASGWPSGTGTRYFAVFQKDGDLAYISFEYNNDLYKDVFNHMLETFSFSSRPENFYDVAKYYMKMATPTPPYKSKSCPCDSKSSAKCWIANTKNCT